MKQRHRTLSSNDGTQDGTFEGRGSCFNRQSHIKNARPQPTTNHLRTSDIERVKSKSTLVFKSYKKISAVENRSITFSTDKDYGSKISRM